MISLLLSLINEILTAAIVVVSFSMLLYNLSRNLKNRIARTAGVVLGCMTITYMADVFISLRPSLASYEVVLRLQWIGVALMPAALFHLSDALLATTGLPSRGRRRMGVRFLYGLSAFFIVMVAFTDNLIYVLPIDSTSLSQRAGVLFGVYTFFFLSTTLLAFVTTSRAKQRCLTRDTHRRMTYLQYAMLTPAFGIYPYGVLLPPGTEFSIGALLLVNIANAIVVLMLLFLSYPLSFFGSQTPDRVVKSELLSFFLKGPATGLLALATIVLIPQVTRILGISGERFMPFAVVAVVLMWQWAISLFQPILETYLIYGDEDSAQLNKLRDMSDRLLSRDDLLQLVDATLQATCDYLQVNTAFVAWFHTPDPEMLRVVGPSRPNLDLIKRHQADLTENFEAFGSDASVALLTWEGYWIAPLWSKRITNEEGQPTLIGMYGVQSRATELNLTEDELQQLTTFIWRTEHTLDDLALQEEIYNALEGLLPQISMTRSRAAEVEYLPSRDPKQSALPATPTLPEQDVLDEQVRVALRHYWGGPGLTRSRLLELNIVRAALAQQPDNPANVLRSVLQQAIDTLRPEGERKTKDPEWLLYNIIEMRFVQGHKVREVADRLARSEPDIYRKQKIAIKAVANALENMEREFFSQSSQNAS